MSPETFVTIDLEQLRQKASERPSGYLEDCLARGIVDGRKLRLTTAYQELLRKYSPRGLGDRIERAAKPIARVIDAVAGTNLTNCGACARRREALNRKFPAGPS